MNRPKDIMNITAWVNYAYYLEDLLAPKPKRSASQNAYLHVCISIYAIELGYTLEEAKTLLKRMCHFMVYEKNGYKFIKKTSGMSSNELTDFIEWIRNHSAQQGIDIPTSEEYNSNRHNIDMEIAKQKQYL